VVKANYNTLLYWMCWSPKPWSLAKDRTQKYSVE